MGLIRVGFRQSRGLAVCATKQRLGTGGVGVLSFAYRQTYEKELMPEPLLYRLNVVSSD